MGLNKVQIIGRLGQDPEVKEVGTTTLAKISLATSEKWKDKDGNMQEKTEWHRINLWGKLGELAGQYLAKGREVYIEGKLQTRSWETETGEKRYATEITGSNLVFLGGKQDSNSAGGAQDSPSDMASSLGVTNAAPTFDSEEELPF